MSQDEIVFDEVQYREPIRLRRPDRDRQWACLAYEVPGANDLAVFLDRATADAIERHALRDTSVELGGILLGKECVDDQTGTPFVWVTKSLEAKHYENTQASFTYTHDAWEEITRERDRLYPDLDIVGWYHTHPDFGVFLSSHDLFIQRHFFAQPLQLAYVVDPIRQTRGFFRWRSGEMEQTGGFFLTAPRGERAALARLVNDLENITDAEPTLGGGLSPRLEAELIAMLTRPPQSYTGGGGIADRAQTALLFSMLGGIFGVLGLCAVLWLGTLNAQLQEQARVIKDLRETVDESAAGQRIALDAALGAAGGAKSRDFTDGYARAVHERDEARKKLDNQAEINNGLAARVKQLNAETAKLQALVDKAAGFEKDAREAVELRAEAAELRSSNEAQAQKIADLEELFETDAGRKALVRARKAQNILYAAIGGWVVSLVLGGVLAVQYLSRKSLTDDNLAPPAPQEPPPHHIS